MTIDPLKRIEEGLRDTLGEIASGAFVDFDSENYARLYRNVPQPSQEVLGELFGYGWLEPNPSGRGYRLSAEGHRAYMKATDELQGKLVRPCKTFNPNPGSPHSENIARAELEAELSRLRGVLEAHNRHMIDDLGYRTPDDPELAPACAEDWRRIREALPRSDKP